MSKRWKGVCRAGQSCYRILISAFAVLRYPPALMHTPQLQMDRESPSPSILIVRLTGKLSLESVNQFVTTMRTEPAPRLVLDMGGLSFLDSAGVGALVSLFVSRRNHGKTLALAGLTQQGMAVMQVSGLLKLLPIFSNVESAVSQQV
jgi:anti-anti-sigma factor